MLFSNPAVAKFINDNFEPCWEKVRDVPTVTVDFGGGNKVKRTLHGNIATYICTADGAVADVLPGIYSPEQYVVELKKLHVVATHSAALSGHQRAVFLAAYHQSASRQEQSPPATAARPQYYRATPNVSKLGVERPIETALFSLKTNLAAPVQSPQVKPAPDLSRFPLLGEDTRVNESLRRKLIHVKLAGSPTVTPDQLKTWLYREVLHADLEDPYLGLAPALFANYPFETNPSQ